MYLEEKRLTWEGVYIDILKGDQFKPDYLKLNPKAVVPTLVHDDKVVRDSTVICEYVEDVYPEHPIRPTDPLTRAEVMYWTKAVDEDLHPACGALTFMASHRHTIQALGPDGVKQFLGRTPPFSVTADWHEQKKLYVQHGFNAPGGAKKVELYDRYIDKMEAALKGRDWLAGDAFSFADIAMTPYVSRLDMLSMDGMWRLGRRPGVEDWYIRVQARPSYRPSLLDWLPDGLRHDLKTNGTKSWPEVARILDIAA
jgi:glutathione S-transferase